MSKIDRIPQNITRVGFDIDETLVPWLEPHVSALEQLAFKLSEARKMPIEEVIHNMAMVYEHKGTLDFTRVIQNMECFKGLPVDELIDLVVGGSKMFQEIRDHYDYEIEGVRELLDRLLDNGVYIFALSSAPLYKAIRRLKRRGLDDRMKLICGVRDTIKDLSPMYVNIRTSFGDYSGKFEKKELEIHKPDTNLAEVLNISPEEVAETVAFVGNSQAEDVGLALRNNCVGFHAEWVKFPPYFLDRLRRFSTPKLEQKYVNPDPARTKAVKEYGKRIDVDNPLNILDHLGIPPTPSGK